MRKHEERSIEMMHAEWLPIIMQGSFSEIYVIDCATLHFVEVNEAARTNLHYSADELLNMTPLDISENLTVKVFKEILQPLRNGETNQASFNTIHVRKDGTVYPIEFRLFHFPSDAMQCIIAIGNDISARYETARALRLSESRFHAIVSNTPGLAYQFRLHKDGTTTFPYLSEGCQALLGISPDKLRDQPELFLQLILPQDRNSYLESMEASATDNSSWNWEGRIWIEEWKDIKWINLRCTPRLLIGDDIQWEGIMTNITQSKFAEEEIKKSRAQLAELSAHDEKVKEQERTRISREIHDDIGGNLTAIKMALALLTRRLPTEDGSLLEKANYVDSLVDRTIESIHRISGDLRPGILDIGLVAAIKWQINEFEKQAGIACEFSTNKKEIDLHLDHSTALFRIFQEALTNISKHAKATHVDVKLVRSNRSVRLEISDNGKGLGSKDRLKPKSFGIRGMIERANALGGDLSVSTRPEGGCLVAIKIPLAAT
jgi:two-component system, NarL family, sensor histidine kinase UhpB